MKSYYVKYRKFNSSASVKGIAVLAKDKYDAYDKAVYEAIPEQDGVLPYSAWVSSVTYGNGNVHHFNTFEGMPY